jgi:2'-5' RNA ligase
VPTAVLCAAFDAGTDAEIEQVRDQVEAAGHRVRRAHRPHLTLTAARVTDVDEVVALATDLAHRHAPIPTTITGFGTFPSGVLYLAPEESVALRALQRDAYEAMAARWPPAFGPQSDPTEWSPHCTLATRLPRPALRKLRNAPMAPFPVLVAALSVILVGGSGDIALIPLAAGPQGPR